MKNKEIIKKAFEKSIPIMCSYLFVSIAYGVMMNEAGFSWYVALLVSFLIYTGAFQFLLITLLSGGTSLLTIGVTALLMNSRQLFYSLSFIDVFNKMKQKCHSHFVYIINICVSLVNPIMSCYIIFYNSFHTHIS